MKEKKLYHNALEQELLSGKNLKKRLDAQIRAENVVRGAAESSTQKPGTGSLKRWIAIPAVALLLVLTLAIGTIVAMRGMQDRQQSALQPYKDGETMNPTDSPEVTNEPILTPHPSENPAGTPVPTPAPILPDVTPQPSEIPASTPVPTPTPGPTGTPDPAAALASLPLFAELKDDFMWPDQEDVGKKASFRENLFAFDWDLDGAAENIAVSYQLTGTFTETVTVSDGKRSVRFEVGGIGIRHAMLLDLDPQSPHANLVLVIWEGEGWPYVTYSLVPDGDSIKVSSLNWYCEWNDGALLAEEEYGFLGYVSGTRSYHGDTLTPDSDWIDIVLPSEEIDRESLVEQGLLLHAVRDIPCTIDGAAAVIPAGTYLRMTRYNVAEVIAEVRTEDGTTAWISGVYDEKSPAGSGDREYLTHFLIDGVNQEEYFDVLFDHD